LLSNTLINITPHKPPPSASQYSHSHHLGFTAQQRRGRPTGHKPCEARQYSLRLIRPLLRPLLQHSKAYNNHFSDLFMRLAMYRCSQKVHCRGDGGSLGVRAAANKALINYGLSTITWFRAIFPNGCRFGHCCRKPYRRRQKPSAKFGFYFAVAGQHHSHAVLARGLAGEQKETEDHRRVSLLGRYTPAKHVAIQNISTAYISMSSSSRRSTTY
jgi:hypothetical protein